MHAVATTPAGLPGLCRSYAPDSNGLPRYPVGSAPTLYFSRPAQRSLALRPACVLSRLSRPFFIGVFQRDSLPPLTAPTASGWNDQLPGGTLTHWRSPSLHGTPDSPHKRPIRHKGTVSDVAIPPRHPLEISDGHIYGADKPPVKRRRGSRAQGERRQAPARPPEGRCRLSRA